MTTGTVLDDILAHKHSEVADQKRSTPLDAWKEFSVNLPSLRSFEETLRDKPLGVIAELKKASPSKGLIREHFDPIAIAESYATHGAACLSVLTDERFFQGSTSALRSARGTTDLPVLRKEFIVDEYQIHETRLLPADCLLLIVAALDQPQLKSFHELATEMNLDVIVEVHDEAELERALAIDARLIGINNRNLKTFHTDLAVTERLVPSIPGDVHVISESGIRSQADIARLKAVGVRAFLVGEAFMREADPGQALERLIQPESAAISTASHAR